jgi:mono/diheme cytochrome c family protein
MRRILPLIVILSAGALMVSFIGCSKKSEDKLAPAVPCDTLNVSYQTQIVSILQENCYSCHGNGSTAGSGGINLNTYVNLKIRADNGDLVGNVTHAAGYPGMPYGKPPLPSCEINTIVAWVHQGALNN